MGGMAQWDPFTQLIVRLDNLCPFLVPLDLSWLTPWILGNCLFFFVCVCVFFCFRERMIRRRLMRQKNKVRTSVFDTGRDFDTVESWLPVLVLVVVLVVVVVVVVEVVVVEAVSAVSQ